MTQFLVTVAPAFSRDPFEICTRAVGSFSALALRMGVKSAMCQLDAKIPTSNVADNLHKDPTAHL